MNLFVIIYNDIIHLYCVTRVVKKKKDNINI